MSRRIRCRGKPLTAVILAGGRGLRMKADKARLPVPGGTLLSRKIGQLRPYFDEILVSVSAGQPQDQPGVRYVEDEVAGAGPMAGISAGLKAAKNETCFVVACDIPDIEVGLIRRLAGAASGHEIVVPVTQSGQCEPLYAIYAKRVIPRIEVLFGRGVRKIIPLFAVCSTAFLPMERYDVDMDLMRGFPADVCRRWCVAPFDRMSKSILVATVNPFNRQAAKELADATSHRLLWYLTPPPELTSLIRKAFR